MAKQLVDDELWSEIKPLLPEPKKRRFRFPGRKPIDDRKALSGILFVLISGIPWEMLPQEMGCGSGMTCWRRLRDWHEQGVWKRLHQKFLDKLGDADKIDWSRAIIDSGSIRAVGGGKKNRPQPYGSKKARIQTSYRNRRARRALGIFSYRRANKRYNAALASGR
jgi:transposase